MNEMYENFVIQLDINNYFFKNSELIEFDETLHDINTIFDEVCDFIEENQYAKFSVIGFYEKKWPVQISTDLPVLLEQLPKSIAAIKKDLIRFEIDFYEQGIERELLFKRGKGDYLIECRDRIQKVNLTQNNRIVKIDKFDLITMFLNLGLKFNEIIKMNYPYLLNTNTYKKWAKHFCN